MAASVYVDQQRREYSLYIMRMRAIPAVTDGLKAGGRRVLWTARDGKKYKTAALAGATMPIHPHSEASGAINTLTAPYVNNIPLFKGDGAFGTLLNPTAYGAARYTSVTVSKFTQDVIFRDMDIIPMTENYDGTLEEPVHFLPLVPTVLLNPAEGIAIGFATNILPRGLDDVILTQLVYLKGQKTTTPIPKCIPLDNMSHRQLDVGKGIAYYFKGETENINATTLRITKLPYGLAHDKAITTLAALYETGTVVEYEDLSRDVVDIVVQFKRGFLRGKSEEDILDTLGLVVRHIENLNVLDFSGQAVWNTDPVKLIQKFTDWRLTWYVKRYERLRALELLELQRWLDIQTAITHKINNIAHKVTSRAELKQLIVSMKIVNVDYVADLPIYRFTEEENEKNNQRIKAAQLQIQAYDTLLASENARRKVYTQELEEILAKYNKGQYKES
jgi:topoisomerase-4 subunit A